MTQWFHAPQPVLGSKQVGRMRFVRATAGYKGDASQPKSLGENPGLGLREPRVEEGPGHSNRTRGRVGPLRVPWGRFSRVCPLLVNLRPPSLGHLGQPPHIPWGRRIQLGAENLVCIFFALFNEGDGLRSKAVGHFIRSEGDSKDVLVISVVIPQPADEHTSVLL